MTNAEKKKTNKEAAASKEAQPETKVKAVAKEKKTATKSAGKSKAKVSTVTVTLKKSGIGRPKGQKATLVGLGFKRLNQTLTLKDTAEARGMIQKVSHLVTIE